MESQGRGQGSEGAGVGRRTEGLVGGEPVPRH